MDLYKNTFKKTLMVEDFNEKDAPHRGSESDDIGSDTDVWANKNPNISNNEDLLKQFNTDGLDKAEIDKYSDVIAKWGMGISTAIDQLAQIVKFSASEKLAGAPGSDQFSALIKDAPRLKKDLSAFKSQVEDLSETVKLAINDEAIERRNKIDSL